MSFAPKGSVPELDLCLKEDFERVKEVAQRCIRFTRLPITIQLRKTDREAACIDMRTNVMYLAYLLGQCPPSYIEFTVGHEEAHITDFPKNARWWKYYQMFAEEQGYDDPHGFTNILADLFANNWNLLKAPWHLRFEKESKKYYKGKKHLNKDKKDRWGFICRMMLGRVYQLRTGHPPRMFIDEYEEEAFQILFHDKKKSRRHAFEELCRLLKHKFAKLPKQPPGHKCKHGVPAGGECDGKGGCGGTVPEGEAGAAPGHGGTGIPSPGSDHEGFPGTLPNTLSPEEFEEWKKAVKGLGKKAVGKMIKDATDNEQDRYMLFDLCELLAFQEFMVAEDEADRKAKQKQGPRFIRTWEPTDDPDELDMEDTIGDYGVFIPGETSQKRLEGILYEYENTGKGTLFILFDTSGSMGSSLGTCLTIGWAAVIAARKRKDRVAAMEFDCQANYLLEPGYEYEKLKEIMQKLSANGGTTLNPALLEIIRVTKENKRKPTVLIFTDTWISDGEQTVFSSFKKISDLGGRTLVCNPDGDDGRYGSKDWATKGHKQKIINLFHVGDISRIGSAVKEFAR